MGTIASICILAAAAIVGGILRHLQGGLDAEFGMHRWMEVVLYSLFGLPALYLYSPNPYLMAGGFCAFTGLFIADMTLGQDFSNPWKVLWRFGTFPLIVAGLTGWWWAILAGPVLATGTYGLILLGDRAPTAKPYFDGWQAYWEVMIGAITGATFTAACLYGGW